MLGEVVAGSEAAFVAEMNGEARTLGMDHTTYTDPSGWDPGTVSTAADQLRVFQQAMRFTIFRQIVSMPNVTLPVAGTLTNFNPVVADGYAGKTGSDSAAGGCLAFFTNVTMGGQPVTAVGVVLGQGQGSNTQAILAAAGHAAEQLVQSGDPNAVNHEKAVAATVSTAVAPAGSLPARSTPSPSKLDPSTSSRSSAPSPSGKLPSPAQSSLPTNRRAAAGSVSTNSPAGSLPGHGVEAPRPASASASSSTGTLPSSAHSPSRSTTGTPAGLTL